MQIRTFIGGFRVPARLCRCPLVRLIEGFGIGLFAEVMSQAEAEGNRPQADSGNPNSHQFGFEYP
jgi:hypothetical protein